MLSESGELKWAASYRVWGSVRSVRAKRRVNGGDEALDCLLRFAGQWSDAETGLYYNRHRHYDPLVGQYASPDPIGLEGGDRPQGWGATCRKPSGRAISQTKGRNRWEKRELTMFPVKAWLRDTPWEPWIKTVLRLERTVHRRNPTTGLLTKTNETVFWISSLGGIAPEIWNQWIRGHWRIENSSHYVRDAAFAEDASRIRKNPEIVARLRSFAYNLIRASGEDNIQDARYRPALDLPFAISLVSK